MMSLFGVSVGGDASNLLRDYYLSNGAPIGGVLLFKRKRDAEAEAESMNKMRKGMKLSECYSAVKVEEGDIPPIYGKIIDGKQG
jgi:hypothetical protein